MDDLLHEAGHAADAGMGSNPVGVAEGACPLPGKGAAPPPPPPTPAPVRPKVAPVITTARNEVLVHKTYIPAAQAVRTRINLTDSEPGGFDGSGTLTVSTTGGAQVDFFDAAIGGNVIVSTGGSAGFTAAQLNAGVTLHAQGSAPSAALNDVTLELALSPGPTRDVLPPQSVVITSIEVFLEICQSRTGVGAEPVQIGVPDKVTEGRIVHIQDGGRHHGRALVIVHKAQPDNWPGNMELRAFDGRVRLFNEPEEVAAGGQTAVPLPHPIANAGIPPTGVRFWAEGVTVSGGLRDTGFQLGVPGLSRDGDWVRMTAVRFRNLRATVPATAPHTVRGNVPAVHQFSVPDASLAQEEFAPKVPLVLVENSVLDAKLVNLSVQIAPAGVPVFWKIQRAQLTGNANPFDHADVIALSATAEPTLDPVGSDTLTPTLKSDAVGSFHIHAYVDCNGTGDFERDTPAGVRIDREPYAALNLVLAHIELDVDDSQTHSANFTGVTDGAGGISLNSGDFNIATPLTNGIHMNARIIVVGGGPDGKTGVDHVFGGWVNNIPSIDVQGTFVDSTVAPPVNHRSRFVFVSNQAAGPFIPGGTAPSPRGLPLLDVGGGASRAPQGTGGETATLSRSRIRARRDRAPDPGQFLRIESVDCPRLPLQGTHRGFPAAQLTHYRFRLNFRVALCVWTGTLGASATAANRLYSVVQEYDWKMRADWNIAPATGAVTLVGNATIRISDITTHKPADPVEGGDIEVRFPTALNSLAEEHLT